MTAIEYYSTILQCQTARIGEVDGAPCLLPGYFSHQDAYLKLETKEWEKPTAELKAAFRKIAALVKSRCPAFEYKPGSTVFISLQSACDAGGEDRDDRCGLTHDRRG